MTVTLTVEQRERLERLWFYYGNYGPQTTSGNHSFIQRLLEQGIDERSLHTKRTPKSELPTPECEAAVEAILAMNSEFDSSDKRDAANSLRLVSNSEEHSRVDEPEIRDVLDDVKDRSLFMHVRLDGR